MGSKQGYEYRHRFSMVDESEINSQLKSIVYNGGVKTFIFEFRTNFTIKKRALEEGSGDVIIVIDTEVFDACEPENSKGSDLFFKGCFMRLEEYWMTHCEMHSLADEAVAFAKEMVEKDPQLASPVAIVVDLEVRTVQREGEMFDACMERAITAQKLVPLYLWCLRAADKPPLMNCLLKSILRYDIKRMRVEDVDDGIALMPAPCPICSRGTAFGGQISLLACQHAFHSSCIVTVLGNNINEEFTCELTCPICHYPIEKAS